MKMTQIISAIGFAALMNTTVAADYQVSGELLDTQNSRGSKTSYANDVKPNFEGKWTIKPEQASISGNANMLDTKVFTKVKVMLLGTLEGQIKQAGVSHNFGGQGQWDAKQKVFTYLVPLKGSNTGDASNAVGKLKCEGNDLVCDSVKTSNIDWEGLELAIQFSDDMKTFSGKMAAYEASGSGMTKSVTKMVYQLNGQKL